MARQRRSPSAWRSCSGVRAPKSPHAGVTSSRQRCELTTTTALSLAHPDRGQYQKYIEQFVLEYRCELQRVPTAFLGVSGSAAGPESEQRAARDRIKEFCLKTSWVPTLTASFGGAMSYTKYNLLLRWIMKRISQKKGGPTDTLKDHELTNWVDVEDFAREFAARVRSHDAEAVAATMNDELLLCGC